MPDQTYRLRILTADGSNNFFIATSLRQDLSATTTLYDDAGTPTVITGTLPYIADVPNGDGQEVDLITGAVRTGAYQVSVVDVVTGSDGTGTLRLLTKELTSGGRQQLLSRGAVLEVSDDNFATPGTVWMKGYVTNITQVDAVTYSVTVSDTRRVEQSHRAFAWGENPQDSNLSEQVLFPQRGCLLGGPIIGGFGPTPDSGGIEAAFTASESAIWGDFGNRIAAFQFIAASDVAPDYKRQRDFEAYAQYANKILEPFAVSATPAFYSNDVFSPLRFGTDAIGQTWFPNLRVFVTDGTDTWVGVLRGFLPFNVQSTNIGLVPTGRYPYIYATFDGNQPTFPTAGTAVRIRVVHQEVSPASPLYFTKHPVDVVTDLYDSINIAWDSTTAQAVKDVLGPELRLSCRITEPQPMAEWLNNAIFGPFGFGTRNNASGEREFFLTRAIGNTTLTTTVDTDDIVADELPAAWDVDEMTVVTGVQYSYRILAKAITDPDSNVLPPPDGIVETKNSVEVMNSDVSTYSTRVVQYDVPGMVHHIKTWQDAMAELISGTATELFDRFGRGAPTYTLPVLGTSAAASMQVGDELLIDVAHVPNQNYRIGESTIGPRVAQIVRRDETPVGPVYKLVDSGPNQQITTAATIAVYKETLNPRTLASFEVTNAGTLNAIPAGVEVEYATGSSTPTAGGVFFTRYEEGEIPTGRVLLPAFVIGSRVWVRVRTVKRERRPSAWTAWADVALDAWVAPSALTIGTVSATAANLSWTNGNASDSVAVYAYAGGSAPADWSPYRVTVLPPGSTQTAVRGLVSSTVYQVAVAHYDAGTGEISALATNNLTTDAANVLTAPAVRYLIVIPSEQDAQYPSGIALAVYPTDVAYNIEIRRAPDSGGSPGTWETIAIVSGGTQVFADPLPSDGAVRWYSVRHILAGFLPGPWSDAVDGVPAALNPNLVPPPLPTPSLAVAVELDDTDAIVTWTSVGVVTVFDTDNTILSPQPTSPWDVPRDFGGKVAIYRIESRVGSTVITDRIVIPGQSVRITAVTAEKTSGTTMDVTWAVNYDPAGTVYRVDYVITADGSGSGTVVGATSPETITVTSLGSAPEAIVTVFALTSAGQFISSATFSGPLLLAPAPPAPTLVSVTKVGETQSIDCGQTWIVNVGWVTTDPDDVNYEIVLRNYDTNGVVASGLTTASDTYIENTGITGDPMLSTLTHTRRYAVELVRLSDGAVISVLNSGRLTITSGAAC